MVVVIKSKNGPVKLGKYIERPDDLTPPEIAQLAAHYFPCRQTTYADPLRLREGEYLIPRERLTQKQRKEIARMLHAIADAYFAHAEAVAKLD